MKPENRKNAFVLGLDLGTNSIGWSLIDPLEKRIIALGSRIFSPAATGDIDSGIEESNAAARREARQIRRQLWRRRRRKKKLFLLLQKKGLLPVGESRTPEQRHRIISELDENLKKSLKEAGEVRVDHLLPYLLRKKGVEEKISLFEFGRALYHLGQRRGFESNRKQQADDEQSGVVKKHIAELYNEMGKVDCNTLGQYFATLDPELIRIRERYTHRSMYKEEFSTLWDKQAAFYPEILTNSLRQELYQVIFFQRKLKNQKYLVGTCELEPDQRRIPKAELLFQRFRYLQKVNDLRGVNEETGEIYILSGEQKKILADYLENKGDLTFKKIVRLLGLPPETHFNLEAVEKKLPGNRTAKQLRKIFSKQWDELGEKQKDQVVADLLSFEKNEPLRKRARVHWGLNNEQAEAFIALTLEQGYGKFSRKALEELLPFLEAGISLQAAIKELYPERLRMTRLEMLPPVLDVFPEINNPVVVRGLSQLRLIINQLIGKYGTPDIIRIELARSLKVGKKLRRERDKKNKRNRKRREEARAKIILEQELGFGLHPPAWAIEKYLLAQECNWVCPYTGKAVGGLISLLGPESPFQVEHIIPRSRSMDNTYLNKTLCHHEFNMHIKKNMTPWELFHEDTDIYENVLQRVRKFKGDARRAKLMRFTMTPEQVEEEYDRFCERQLRDTAYVSRIAAQYLGILYGGQSDDRNRLRVQVSAGQLTAILRAAWNLNLILGAPYKSRDNHRHHAVDALVTACADPGLIRKIGQAFRKNDNGRGDLSAIEQPWDGFFEDAREKILSFHPSHHVTAPVNGAFHKETVYGRPRTLVIEGKEKKVTFYRKPVTKLSKSEVNRIVDPVVRKQVHKKLEEVGTLTKLDRTSEFPAMPVQNGNSGPAIRKVRLWKAGTPVPIGKRDRQRFVNLGGNHHIEIFAILDKQGKIKKWKGKVVSLFEAMERKRQGAPIINREHGLGTRFLFSFVKGDCFRAVVDGKEKIYQVRMFTTDGGGRIRMIEYSDARQSKALEEKDHPRKSVDQLRKMQCRKITISPIGEVYTCNA